ncbi:MAG: hypothetical protein WCT00_06210 [Bacilli bacterium]
MRIKIQNQQDAESLALILIKNGYKVQLTSEAVSASSRKKIYYVEFEEAGK